MAHFAKLDENNVIVDVLVVNNSDVDNLPFPESESVGIAYLNSFLPPATYAQTSYNGNFRVRFAGVGMAFYPNCTATPYGGFGNTQEYPDFIFDEAVCMWIPPVPYPTDGGIYLWDDALHEWVPFGPQPPKSPTIIG
jgi:hypothetical protein